MNEPWSLLELLRGLTRLAASVNRWKPLGLLVESSSRISKVCEGRVTPLASVMDGKRTIQRVKSSP